MRGFALVRLLQLEFAVRQKEPARLIAVEIKMAVASYLLYPVNLCD
tara:strand:+ start:77 stop:214 length:138 start_codon:yes stop_codon:yes gene_type:complete